MLSRVEQNRGLVSSFPSRSLHQGREFGGSFSFLIMNSYFLIMNLAHGLYKVMHKKTEVDRLLSLPHKHKMRSS